MIRPMKGGRLTISRASTTIGKRSTSKSMKLLVTGGAGFIGSAFIRLSLARDESTRIVNLDKLTYAGNLANLESIAENPHYRFVHGDICDLALVDGILAGEKPDAIVHFAAESHVDR